MGGEQIDQYATHVYRFAVYCLRDHHTALDIAQETMLRAWKQRRQFREIRDPRAWLLRIAANLCRDHVRSLKSAVRRPAPLTADPPGNCPEPWFGILQDERCRELDEVIQSLSDRERTVLYLSAFEGLQQAEIASVLDINPGTVKVTLFRARKSVRQAIVQQHAKENQP